MIATIGRAAIICTLCATIGGHWFFLQSIAWSTMIARYSREMPLAAAVGQTFDGSHPCDMCKHISAVRKSEHKNDAQAGPTKPDLICATRRLVLSPRCIDFVFAPFGFTLGTRGHSPPTPPPRLLLT